MSHELEAIREMLKGIKYMITSALSNTTKVYDGVVMSEDKNGKWNIKYNGEEHSIKLYGTGVPELKSIVKVTVPQGNQSLAFFTLKAGESKIKKATNKILGGILAPDKTADQTEPVGIDADGHLFVKPGGLMYVDNLPEPSEELYGKHNLFASQNNLYYMVHNYGAYYYNTLQAYPGPGAPFISNGLILHLDGRDQGNNPEQWIDKVQGLAFQLSNATKLTNGVRFSGEADSYAFATGINLSSSYYIEYTVTILSSKTDHIILLSSNNFSDNQICTGFYNNTILLISKQSPSFIYKIVKNTMNTFQLSYGDGYVNGNKMSMGANAAWYLRDANIYIGGPSSSQGLNGIIHSIRVYDHVLSPAERAINLKYDTERYKEA